MDWGVGSYERLAVEVEPAAAVAVDALAVEPGSRVLDVGCGNGNAALAAARRGARVTGLDPARRLLELARERADAEGIEADWIAGEAEELPFGDGEFDGLVSVFGVIFAEDGRRAAAELNRVLRPGGAGAITAWIQRGGIADAVKLIRQAMAEHVTPSPDAPPAVDWSDEVTLRELLGPELTIAEHQAPFRADSARAWVDEQREHHPAWAPMQEVLPQGRFDELAEELVGVLAGANEDPDAFLVHSPYVVARWVAA